MVIFVFIVLLAIIPSALPQATRNYDFSVGWHQGSPDGYQRNILSINNQFPAPTITACEGDELRIRVVNTLTDKPVVLHWHGIQQRGTLVMDGAGFVNQCAIGPNQTFVYDFHTPRAGTYWYHSHFSVQYVDGLRGALVVYEKDGCPLNNGLTEKTNNGLNSAEILADNSYVLQLTDWYHNMAEQLLAEFMSPGEGEEPLPDSILINNFGQFYCHPPNTAPPRCSFPTFSGAPASKRRFRLINTSALAIIKFSVDNHRLQVIEIDSTPIVPYVVDSIRINTGQRYSVYLLPNSPVSGSYWIHADIDVTSVPADPPNPNARAILSYTNSDAIPIPTDVPQIEHPIALDPRHVGDEYISWKSFAPLNIRDVPASTRSIKLLIDFYRQDDGVRRASVNGISYTHLTDTTILNYIRAGMNFPKESNVYVIESGEVIDLIVYNRNDEEHPMHLHGHQFWVLAMGNEGDGEFDPNRDPLNTKDPISRDTITVNPTSYVVLRFVADNPGVWLFHCHIDWHLMSGMAIVFAESPEKVRAQYGPTSKLELCPYPHTYL